MKLNIRAPWNSLGYGIAAKNITIALDKLNCSVSYFPIGQPQLELQPEVEVLQRVINNQSNFDSYAPSILIWHQHSLAEHIGYGRHVGFPIFELDKFNEREIHHLSTQEHIFVCSKWAKTIVDSAFSNSKDFCSVVPLGVNFEIFYPKDRPSDNVTKFITIGKWELRKRHAEIIDCFNAAFTTKDRVELNLICHNPFLNGQQLQEWLDYAKNSPLGEKINVLPRLPTQIEVADQINNSDCGIFLSSAEGFNLEALEMMACGTPIIITNYSGHTEFCNSQNSMLIEIDDLEEAYDGIWFNGQGNWAQIGEPQKDQTISYMRKIHKDKQEHKSLFNEEGVATAKRFSWENSACILLSHLERLSQC